MKDMFPVLITWGFDQKRGDVYLDVYLDLRKEDAANQVKLIYVRAQFTQTNVGLIHLPEGADKEDLEKWFEFTKKEELLQKLQKAEVRMGDIVRRKNEGGNAVDFILGGKHD